MAGDESVEPESTDYVSLFVIPEERAESTLNAVMAMNEAGGGDLFMLKAKAAGGTLSGTACVWEGHPPNSFTCGDSDG